MMLFQIYKNIDTKLHLSDKMNSSSDKWIVLSFWNL